jgi:hypothetical protein
MYVPWSQQDAFAKLQTLLQTASPNQGLISEWNNCTIDRCVDIMNGHGEQWLRSGRNYRNHVSTSKYMGVR